MMDCRLCSQLTARRRTPQAEETIIWRNEMVPCKIATPCLHRVLSIPLRHVYNSGMHFYEVETCFRSACDFEITKIDKMWLLPLSVIPDVHQ